MLQRMREGLVLVLLWILPFHALLVTVGTKVIVGPGHAPLPILALWKEALLGAILILALMEWAVKLRMENGKLNIDRIDVCIGGLLFLSIIPSIVLHSPFSILHFVFGFKYDFLPLIAFLILRRVPCSETFRLQAVRCMVLVGGIVAIYGIATAFLPMSWLSALGYSDLHSLYVPGGPLAAFQQIGGTGIRRIQSTMSGPNQLGLWLLIPWSMFLSASLSKKVAGCRLQVTGAILVLVALALTFSRAAWIAAAVILIVVLWKYVPKERFRVIGYRLSVIGTVMVVTGMFFAPDVLFRVVSDRDHFRRPIEALRIMIDHPFGLGLGSAGPASNRFNDTCVDVPAHADTAWAVAHPELCVFVGGTQVQPPLPSGELRPAGQPVDRTCTCPLLPENWYVQIGVEMGWIGFVLYVLLVLFVLRHAFLQPVTCNQTSVARCTLHVASALAFLGISIAALFLHAWEDSAVAYTVWILLAQHVRMRSYSPAPPIG